MKKHILIVDDEADIRSLLAEYLEQRGYQVSAASSETEAQAAIAQKRPDLIISDLQLEDTDGLEMIGRFKEAMPETPVILLTGVLFDAKVVRDTLSRKVAAYVPKTSPLSRVGEVVQQLIGN